MPELIKSYENLTKISELTWIREETNDQLVSLKDNIDTKFFIKQIRELHINYLRDEEIIELNERLNLVNQKIKNSENDINNKNNSLFLEKEYIESLIHKRRNKFEWNIIQTKEKLIELKSKLKEARKNLSQRLKFIAIEMEEAIKLSENERLSYLSWEKENIEKEIEQIDINLRDLIYFTSL